MNKKLLIEDTIQNDTSISELIRLLIEKVGENPERKGLLKTPQRVADSFKFLLKGYGENVEEIINGAIFEEPYDEMVVVRDINFFSLCEHHMLPFFGKCHVAYIPDGRIVGLSKVPRIVEVFSRRLQVQERMTIEIANCLNEHLRPKGVGVIVEGFHLCMAMRGVEKQNATTTTSSMLGCFLKSKATRGEFLNILRNSGVSSILP
jgi:GTP cyclohydrolase I